MQRRKAAVRVEVKQVIQSLCRLLAAVGLESVPSPEDFRRAKFGGGPEVEGQFWQLLANILQVSGISSREAGAQLREEHRKLVAAGLWQTGYHADWIYGSQERFSSRDLLLALGWLLSTGKLEKLLTQRVQQLDKTLLTPLPVNLQLSSNFQLDSASLRKLQWLFGCLRFQGRTLLSMQEERTRLLHSVFLASLPSPVSSSSSHQGQTVQKKDCVCMRQLCDLLEAYLSWKQVEEVFWTWMDSVFDCHLAGPEVKKSLDAPKGRTRVCQHQNQGLQTFEEMLLKLPTEQVISQKGRRRSREETEQSNRQGEQVQGGLDTSCLPPHMQVYRARLQTERPDRRSSHPAEGSSSGAKTPDKLPVCQASQLLRRAEALLLERRNMQRLANRMQLQETIGRLDKLVLIPPETLNNPQIA